MTWDSVWNWLKSVLLVGIPTILAAYPLFKWLGQKWVEQRLNIGLEKVRGEQQKEIERLRHRLSSRISRIHEKEFEILPKAWLMVHELHGSVAVALDLTIKGSAAFDRFSDAQFETFLTVPPANKLSGYQKDELRNASDRKKYFSEAMAGIYLDEAKEKQRQFGNYLIEHRIFMTEDLSNKFNAVNKALAGALTKYSIGKDADDHGMVNESWKEMDTIKELIGKIETSVQERLHFEEAT